jgi:hypothetical protein
LTICDEFWDKFIRLSRAYVQYNPDAEVYDVLNLIREKVNGGWTYTQSYLEKIDNEIAKEEQHARRYGVV